MSSRFPEKLSNTEINELKQITLDCRGDILAMTTLATSGHPGGSMSSIDALCLLYKRANISPANYKAEDRDRIVVSIGHISPAVYSCLGRNGFFDPAEAVSQFRLAGSRYEGHIERDVPGVEWTTGNLGQGLSAACGMAIANRVKGIKSKLYVLMGDGESQKGQLVEACRFAAKYNLSEITAFIDNNRLQISGQVSDVMPQNFAREYEAAGWTVFHADGHDFNAISKAVHAAEASSKPSLVILSTVMGKSVSFMENKEKYHGSPLSPDDYAKAVAELGLPNRLDEYKKLRSEAKPNIEKVDFSYVINVSAKPQLYKADEKTDCRSAFGKTLCAIAEGSEGRTPIAVFDCDLAGSVKTGDVAKLLPNSFFQAGICEHHTAAMAGALSSAGVIGFFADFTMFAVDEVYNQLRINDINHSNLKLISTHAGVDVGEDGRTHQCIDYLGLMRNLFGFKVIAPADPNQTDHALRHAAAEFGNFHIVMGRSKVPTITDERGLPFFGSDYVFEYGKVDKIRKGDVALLSYGVMLSRALKVRDIVGERLAVYNVSSPISPDSDSILELAKAGFIFIYEDHNSASGLKASIADIVASAGVACKVVGFGVDAYPLSGAPDDVFRMLGLSPEIVAEKIKEILS